MPIADIFFGHGKFIHTRPKNVLVVDLYNRAWWAMWINDQIDGAAEAQAMGDEACALTGFTCISVCLPIHYISH